MASLYSISSVARDEGISEEGRVTDEQPSKTPAFTPHALRGRVLAEVHARPFVPMEGAKRILHFAFTTDPPAAAKAREALKPFAWIAPTQLRRLMRSSTGSNCFPPSCAGSITASS